MRSYLTEPSVELADFVRRHPVADLEPPSLDALVATIAREWIIVVQPSGETVLAACVLRDRGDPDGVSEVVLLGCSDLGLLLPALEILLDRAERLLPGGAGRRIEVQVPTMLACLEPELQAFGYRRAWQNVDLTMDLVDGQHAPGQSIPRGTRWQDLDTRTLANARGCYERAFRKGASAGGCALTDYSNRALELMPLARLLVRDGQVLAFTRVAWKDQALSLGEVRNLGRDPDASEPGLGRLALLEALRALGAMGAARAMLTVASHNHRGLALFRTYGFIETERRGVFRKHLAA